MSAKATDSDSKNVKQAIIFHDCLTAVDDAPKVGRALILFLL
jgi:hypothetical protein